MTPFLILLLASCAFCLEYHIDKECLKNADYILLQNEILDHRNNLTEPCTNVYNFMCTAKGIYSRKQPLKNSLSSMKAYLISLLASPPSNEDSELLKVEKTLYKSCLQLGNTKSENQADVESLKSQLLNLNKIGNWLDIEHELFSQGFGYSFFNIKVIPHPEYELVNTILLQPPSLENIKHLTSRFNKIINYRKQYRRNEYLKKAESIHNIYQFVNESAESKVLQFFNRLEKVDDFSAYSTNFPEHYTTVKDFNNAQVYMAYNRKPDRPIEADWVQIIQQSLQRLNISFESDNIILKSPKYFLGLTILLHNTPNDIIVAAIQTKAVTAHLNYLDWDVSNSLETIDRPKFCLEETKLYGASRKLVHDWVNEDDNRFSQYTQGEKILSNVVSTIRDELSISHSESPTKANYYKRKLYYVFESLRKYVYEPPYNLYENFNMSSKSYFKNIIDYRKMLINKNLENLQEKYESHAFSFIDQDEPQNRFVIHTLVNIAEMFSPDLPMDVHYGTFGVRVASLIHSLLQEDTFNVEITNVMAEKSSYPKYSEKTKDCIMQKLDIYNPDESLNDIVSQVLALNTAFNASMRNTNIPFHGNLSNVLFQEKITKEKLFFLAYVKDSCYQDSAVLNNILSHDYSFNKAFDCQSNAKREKTCIL